MFTCVSLSFPEFPCASARWYRLCITMYVPVICPCIFIYLSLFQLAGVVLLAVFRCLSLFQLAGVVLLAVGVASPCIASGTVCLSPSVSAGGRRPTRCGHLVPRG